MRVPLVIVPPKNMEIPAGRSEGFASLLDLYPNLADMCGLVVSPSLDGQSLKPIITEQQLSVRDHIVTTLGSSTFCIRKGGIGERFESMVDKSEIAKFMRRYLQEKNISDRYVTIPDDAK